MRKIRIILPLILAAAIAVAGCSTHDTSSEAEAFTLETFMAEVNQKHQAVSKPEVDYSQYTKENPTGYFGASNGSSVKNTANEFSPSKVFTMEQVEKDVDILFRAFTYNYGGYYYYGGDEAFRQAKEAILEECSKESETGITGGFLLECLTEKLSFIRDGHMQFEGKYLSDFYVPSIYREIAFVKTKNGYQTIAESQQPGMDTQKKQPKIVKSVEGWEDLDLLFKRSISDEGQIVYYPVVLYLKEGGTILKGMDATSDMLEDLTVHYSDGSAQVLSAVPYQRYQDTSDEEIEFHMNQDVPVVVSRKMRNAEVKTDVVGKEFLSYVEKYKEEPVIIVDLRSNKGGHVQPSFKWWEIYTGQHVTTNFVSIEREDFADVLMITFDENAQYYISSQTMQDTLGYRKLSKGYAERYSVPEHFIDNDKLVIILTSKNTASAAEIFTDIAHNVSNTLVIGENSCGCMFGSASGMLQLPNTHIRFTYGTYCSIFPDDPTYFQEFRGLEPDLWVNAEEAEELAMKFIEYY